MADATATAPLLDLRETCTGCGRLLPAFVRAADCHVCRIRRERDDELRCRCWVPVFDRRYLGHWLCRRCGHLWGNG